MVWRPQIPLGSAIVRVRRQGVGIFDNEHVVVFTCQIFEKILGQFRMLTGLVDGGTTCSGIRIWKTAMRRLDRSQIHSTELTELNQCIPS